MTTARSSEARVGRALRLARERLLAQRSPDGHWSGELSSSALSTATAATALAILGRALGEKAPEGNGKAVQQGLRWLTLHANSDGGWGDTTDSPSNLSTTALCWAAFGALPEAAAGSTQTVAGAESYLEESLASQSPLPDGCSRLAEAIASSYGHDRTFSAPILTMCALSGRLGQNAAAWCHVPQLPFELAALPQWTFAALRLPVVSYALPALIAIGYARHVHRPTRNPMLCLLRRSTAERTLNVLGRIQPASGGYLEATPLTSFVLMSLASSGKPEHPVARKAADFLLKSQRPDGSWPIDTNLSTWVTTLSVNALQESGLSHIAPSWKSSLLSWLLCQQSRSVHPYTGAAPGGWAWTDLPGGVPDTDDTAGAVLGLAQLVRTETRTPASKILASAVKGIRWLLGVQNRDGGIPTFCPGWGNLPFDCSSPDLTGHALRAWAAWREMLPVEDRARANKRFAKAVLYLAQSQRADGAWIPLWFGNQLAPNQENPTYGTSRVVHALCEIHQRFPLLREPLVSGLRWLLESRNTDGGWGGAAGTASSVEETALAVEALSTALMRVRQLCTPAVKEAVQAGADWLAEKWEAQIAIKPSPIGLYFARLWYSERLYPLIFSVAGLTAAESVLGQGGRPG